MHKINVSFIVGNSMYLHRFFLNIIWHNILVSGLFKFCKFFFHQTHMWEQEYFVYLNIKYMYQIERSV